MESLQFTFNSRQLSHDITTLVYRNSAHPSDFSMKKGQIGLPSFRSKRFKRYEDYIENVNLEDLKLDPMNCQKRRRINSLYDDNIELQPTSSKQIDTFSLRPKVSTRSKKFPSDFNMKNGAKPKSMHLIREQKQKEEQKSFKKQIIQQMVSKKRSFTSKETPKIHFPNNNRVLPSVFRMKSISYEKLAHENTSKKKQMTSIDCEEVEQTPKKKFKKKQIYFQLAKLTQNISKSQTKNSMYGHKKIEFVINAQETPRFTSKA